jgi:hypothetical protein
VAQLFSLGHEILLRFLASQIGGRRFLSVRFSVRWAADIFGRRTARADLSAAGRCGSLPGVRRAYLADDFMQIYVLWPNKSPEPTAVGAFRSAVAVHVASRRWLSFFR